MNKTFCISGLKEEGDMNVQKIAAGFLALALVACGPEESKAPPPAAPVAAPAEPAKVQYPTELLGKFANTSLGKNPCAIAEKSDEQTDMWPGLYITADGLQSEGLYCVPKKIEGSDGKFTIVESCSGDGGEPYELNPQYEINGKELKATYIENGKPSTYKYVACKPKVKVACGIDAITMFKGTNGKKVTAICAYPSKGPITQVEYKYGPKDDAELTYVANTSNSNRFYVDSETVNPTANVTTMWFQIGDTYYGVTSCMGGMCKYEATGVAIQDNKYVSTSKFKDRGDDFLQLENSGVFTNVNTDYKFSSKTELIQQKSFPSTLKKTPAELFY